MRRAARWAIRAVVITAIVVVVVVIAWFIMLGVLLVVSCRYYGKCL
jgi:hypothetical protein